MLETQSVPTRSTNIHFRVSPEKRTLIDRAAQVEGKTRTDYILDVVTRDAQAKLLDQRVFMLDEEEWARFNELLDAPPQPSEGLRRLMATQAPWE